MTKVHDFEIEHAGQRHAGTWRVENRMIYVSSAYGPKATQVGSSEAGNEHLAKMMLRELVQEAERKGAL